MNLKNNNKVPSTYFLYDFVKITGAIPTFFWNRLKVVYAGEGKKPKFKGTLVTANHNSIADPVILLLTFWKRRLHCLATSYLYRTKISRFFFNHLHCIEVNKANFSMESFHQAVDLLKKDKIVAIFPEGQLNENSSDELKKLKSGAILIANNANKPILPLYIVPFEKWYKRRVVIMGDLIDVRKRLGPIPSIKAIDEMANELCNVELQLKHYYYEEYKRK